VRWSDPRGLVVVQVPDEGDHGGILGVNGVGVAAGEGLTETVERGPSVDELDGIDGEADSVATTSAQCSSTCVDDVPPARPATTPV
jgi:hypothetical protein